MFHNIFVYDAKVQTLFQTCKICRQKVYINYKKSAIHDGKAPI